MGEERLDGWPRPQGGDRLSHRTEAHAPLIHATLAEVSDITLPELKARLLARGASVKDLRRIATRYDKLANNFLASAHLVAAFTWWL